ncbi:putative Histidine kinase [Verrucomicrobia bacterium]|nr:putative Histidine kinase [Verrucomicrobiota bacterium]
MNFFRRASIKRKQVLISMTITGVALLLACAGFTSYEVLTFRSAMVRKLSLLAEIIGDNTASALDFGDSKAAAETLAALKAETHIVGARVYAADGRAFATYRRAPNDATFVFPAVPPSWDHAFRNSNLMISRRIVSKGDAVGSLYLISDVRELYSRLGQYAVIITAVLLLTLVVALGLSERLQHFISEPILRLATAAKAVGQTEDYSIRVEKRNPDEIGVLIDGFNEMLNQIQEREAQLQKAREVLEVRVTERTMELAEAIAALQKENLERKQAEAAVRRTEELYRRTISGADAVPYAYDYRTKSYVFIDERIEELLGYTAKEITPALWNQIVEESIMVGDSAGLDKQEAARRVISGQLRNWRCDMRVVTRSGATRWISDASVHNFDEAGQFIGSLGILQDITERKQAEETLRSQEERTRLIIDQAFDAVVMADQDFRIIGWNRSAERTLGWAASEILGASMLETIVPPARRQKRREDLQRFQATGEWADFNRLVQSTAMRHDGRELPVELTITPVRVGDHCIFTLFLRDITERRQAEAALAYERHLLETLMEHSVDCIYFKDRESRFLRSSRSLRERFAHGVPELIGKTDFDLFGEEHARPAFENEQEIIRTGRPLINKIEKEVARDGHESWALTTKMPLLNQAGEIVGTFGISKDITAIKQAEAELEHTHKELVVASRLAGMAEVATNVLHNVGNVLNSINVAVTLVDERVRKSRVADVRRLARLLDEHAEDRAAFLTSDPRGQSVPDFIGRLAEKLDSEQVEMIEELSSLRRNVEHVKEIIAMQQSYARAAGVFENIEVSALLEDALRMNAGSLERHKVKVVRDFSELPQICTDKHKVLQILVNLVRNAKYACDKSGQTDKQMTLRATSGEGRVRIAVIDNGVGIPRENLSRIFNHGFTTRKNGHGFGLHSGALAARELGGSLSAYSQGKGLGAKFTLELPCQPAASSQTLAAQDPPGEPVSTPQTLP